MKHLTTSNSPFIFVNIHLTKPSSWYQSILSWFSQCTQMCAEVCVCVNVRREVEKICSSYCDFQKPFCVFYRCILFVLMSRIWATNRECSFRAGSYPNYPYGYSARPDLQQTGYDPVYSSWRTEQPLRAPYNQQQYDPVYPDYSGIYDPHLYSVSIYDKHDHDWLTTATNWLK